jgi:primary-amine oxidase
MAAVALGLAGAGQAAQARQGHPLDSLRGEEVELVSALLRAAGVGNERTRFAAVRLAPPYKDQVWQWRPGNRVNRRAIVVLRTGTEVREAIVDLDRKTIVRVDERPGVQTGIAPDEWARATKLVKADPRWQAAMRLRGIDRFEPIFCDALSVGSFGALETRRLLKVPCYDARGTRNVYGRPIEGVMGLVDLDRNSVVQVSDSGVVPVSTADPSLEQERRADLRPAARPILSSAPAGFNFTVRDNLVRWETWSFHLSFDQRVGPIVSTVRYDDAGRLRPVLYQGHLSEMFVPYMDPDPNWSFRSYMDAGEYGFGSLASRLVAGVDCPAGAIMLGATMPTLSGTAAAAPDVMCVFERNTTTALWRRHEIVTGSHESRQDVELVVRTIPTVGNYDYIYDWVFNRKGEIRIDVGATGIAAAKGVAPTVAGRPGDLPHGSLVAPNIAAPYHDHFLSFRLDLDVDGSANHFISEKLVRQTLPPSSQRRSVWVRQESLMPAEFGIESSHVPEIWRVENRKVRTPLGYSPSFEIATGHNSTSLLGSDDWAQRRAAFSASALWVTAYKPAELYAAGDYPNQSATIEGLPRFVNGEGIAGKDLVAWYTMGFHHVTRPEDWPVLPTVRHSVTLRPHRFFTENPAVNVRREARSAPPAGEPR